MLFSRLRAEVVTEFLCEMNPDVKGIASCNSPLHVLESEDSKLRDFSLIIVSNQSEALRLNVSRLCWSFSIPLIVVRSFGFIGSVRLQLRLYAN